MASTASQEVLLPGHAARESGWHTGGPTTAIRRLALRYVCMACGRQGPVGDGPRPLKAYLPVRVTEPIGASAELRQQLRAVDVIEFPEPLPA